MEFELLTGSLFALAGCHGALRDATCVRPNAVVETMIDEDFADCRGGVDILAYCSPTDLTAKCGTGAVSRLRSYRKENGTWRRLPPRR